MAIANPKLGSITAADVTRMKTAADLFDQVIPIWSADPRYAGQVGMVINLQDELRTFAQMISDYLAVQGT